MRLAIILTVPVIAVCLSGCADLEFHPVPVALTEAKQEEQVTAKNVTSKAGLVFKLTAKPRTTRAIFDAEERVLEAGKTVCKENVELAKGEACALVIKISGAYAKKEGWLELEGEAGGTKGVEEVRIVSE
jgi:hypothetical protein